MNGIQNKITSILQTFLLVMFTVCALDVCGNSFGRNLPVNLGSLDLLMSEQPLNGSYSQAILDEQSCECVACSMESVMLRYAYLLQDFSQSLIGRRITADFSYQPFNSSITLNDGRCFTGKNIVKRNIYHEALTIFLWIHCLTICSLLRVTKSEKRNPV